MQVLECPDANCDGPLSFGRLMNSTLYARGMKAIAPGQNPFIERPAETSLIVQSIQEDLDNIRVAGGNPPFQLDPRFLVHPAVRVNLVGIVNRMDRQFHRDQRESDCGEISLIYRFAYPLSRLPATMNIVFPAAAGKLDCKTAARGWLTATAAGPTMSPQDLARLLMSGPLSHLKGKNIARLELNMQAYRKPASLDYSDFGSEATYLIRVFRWTPRHRRFEPSFLPNEINRSALLCDPRDSTADCGRKRALRKKLVRYLQKPKVVRQIDQGILDLPMSLGVLSMRAISVSPGGFHRSINQPYWNAASDADRPQGNIDREEIISDAEIEKALASARAKRLDLHFIGDADDFRARLNDSTCTGCHQTRAIAGFHFPGQDPLDTPAPNAVYLAGSALFYGDQPRRMEVVHKVAESSRRRLRTKDLTTSFSARPLDKYASDLGNTALIGGWGSACLLPQADGTAPASKREWSCQPGLTCTALFASSNARRSGTCIPQQHPKVGDPLQTGTVTTTGWGHDLYERTTPDFGVDEYAERDTRIPDQSLPPSLPNQASYRGSHQEFYTGHRGVLYARLKGECANGTRPKSDCYAANRDRLSGGFPAGMLSLAECAGLPEESTCALVASSGFNSCIASIGTAGFEDFTLYTCFDYFTSYAGLRACDVGNPCRDDYICVRPIDPKPAENIARLHSERMTRLLDSSAASPWNRINNADGSTPYDPSDFGQQRPDDGWIEANDSRGMCIPPYFVFQFRSDRHPSFPSRKKPRVRTPEYGKEAEF
jgi:hypothetical protein